MFDEYMCENRGNQMRIKSIIVLLIVFGSIIGVFGNNNFSSGEPEISRVSDGMYIPYSIDSWNSSSDKIRVLFFHASWCSSCRIAERSILENYRDLSDSTVVFKIDYDTNSALKRKYGISRQHTFVIINRNGEVLKKWNGGNISRIVEEVGKI